MFMKILQIPNTPSLYRISFTIFKIHNISYKIDFKYSVTQCTFICLICGYFSYPLKSHFKYERINNIRFIIIIVQSTQHLDIFFINHVEISFLPLFMLFNSGINCRTFRLNYTIGKSSQHLIVTLCGNKLLWI